MKDFTGNEINSEIDFIGSEESVTLVNLVPAKVIVSGGSTGVEYTFDGPGAEVKVNKEDAEILLLKTRGAKCCGGDIAPMFELVEGR